MSHGRHEPREWQHQVEQDEGREQAGAQQDEDLICGGKAKFREFEYEYECKKMNQTDYQAENNCK